MATYLENLVTIRDGIASLIATEVAYQLTNGPKPSYSIDGESVDWPGWFAAMSDRLDSLNEQIKRARAPFMVVSRGRA